MICIIALFVLQLQLHMTLLSRYSHRMVIGFEFAQWLHSCIILIGHLAQILYKIWRIT